MKHLNTKSTYITNDGEGVTLSPLPTRDLHHEGQGWVGSNGWLYTAAGAVGIVKGHRKDIAREKLKLRVGGKYLDINGKVVEITRLTNNEAQHSKLGFKFASSNSNTYTEDGLYSQNNPDLKRLIEEVQETKAPALVIKVGGLYRDRNNRKVRIEGKINENSTDYRIGYQFISSRGFAYTLNGNYHKDSTPCDWDLVEEIIETQPEENKNMEIKVGNYYALKGTYLPDGTRVQCIQITETKNTRLDGGNVVVDTGVIYYVKTEGGKTLGVEATGLTKCTSVDWTVAPEWAKQVKFIDGQFHWYVRNTTTCGKHTDTLLAVSETATKEWELCANYTYNRGE